MTQYVFLNSSEALIMASLALFLSWLVDSQGRFLGEAGGKVTDSGLSTALDLVLTVMRGSHPAAGLLDCLDCLDHYL